MAITRRILMELRTDLQVSLPFFKKNIDWFWYFKKLNEDALGLPHPHVLAEMALLIYK